jgi:hypothetical protein
MRRVGKKKGWEERMGRDGGKEKIFFKSWSFDKMWTPSEKKEKKMEAGRNSCTHRLPYRI